MLWISSGIVALGPTTQYCPFRTIWRPILWTLKLHVAQEHQSKNIAALVQVSHKQREFEYEIVLEALKEENPLEEK
jgi:hypothetical protein